MEKLQFLELCKQYNIDMTIDQVGKFEKYYNYLIDENNKYNLTAIVDKEDVYLKHFLDSLLGTKLITDNSNVLDIGCGAGFPSIPLAIFKKSCNFTLIDSVNKKVGFVNNLIDLINIDNAIAIHTRCEDFAKNELNREKFDIVVTRAVAPMNVLLEYCIPFLKIGGKCIMYKGANYNDELKLCKNAISKLNCKLYATEKVYFKEIDAYRYFIIFEKTQKTPNTYPRLQNKVRKQPL